MVERLEAVPADSARHEHSDALAYPVRTRNIFDDLLMAVAGISAAPARDGRRAAMRSALDNRATWEQIKHWRRGTIAAPIWAIKILTDKLAARAALQNQLMALGAMHKPGRGQGWRRSA